jgi:hypothetical protein
LYQFFGKNKKKDEENEVKVVSNGVRNEAPVTVIAEPYQSAAQPLVNVNAVAVADDGEALPF